MTAAMTPTESRAMRRVNRWVRWYTRGLPEPIATARRAELASDLYEQQALQAAQGPERLSDRGILARSFRGVLSDLAWARSQSRRTTPSGVQGMRRGLEWAAVLALVLSVVIAVRIIVRALGSGALEWDVQYSLWTAWTPSAAWAVLAGVAATVLLVRAAVDILIGATRTGTRWFAAGNVLLVVAVFYGMEYVWGRGGYLLGRVVQKLELHEMTVPILFMVAAAVVATLPLLLSRRLSRH